jgi:alkyldihydroxyacetonephosphate synthase
MKDHIKALKKLLPKAVITDDKVELEAYKDIIYSHKPPFVKLVVKPRDNKEVAALLKYCNHEKLAVTPWGGATNLSGSLTPTRPYLALDLKDLNRILDFSKEDRTVTVEAGATIEKVENYLNRRGFTLGHDPWSRSSATIGGALALDSAGNLFPKYGSAGDLVLTLKVALANGDIATVGKNISKSSSSPFLPSLFIGSAGIFGVILEATMRISPLAKERITLGYSFKSFEKMFAALKELEGSGIEPQSYIGGTLPKVVVKLRSKTEQALVKMLSIDSALFIYYEGSEGEVKARLKEAKVILGRFGKKMPDKYSREWWEDRHKYFEMSKDLADENLFLHVFDLCVPRSNLLKANLKIKKIAKKMGLDSRISLSIFSALDAYTVALYLDDGQEGREILSRFEEEIIKVTHSLNGTIARTHGLGSLYGTKDILDKEIGKHDLEFLGRMKLILDPNDILNPGIIIQR